MPVWAKMINRKAILVVEDSATVQKVIATSLNKQKHLVIQALSMEDALRHPKSASVNVAIVDLILPGIGGIAGIGLLRERWPEVGIVAMSGGNEVMGADNLLTTARKVGAHRILKKPFAEEELISLINGLLEQGFGEEDRKDRILVIDDSRTIRKLMTKFLTEAGYAVVEAESMEEALESPDILSVDVIVTDIFMPGLGGIAGIQEIKRNWPHVPVIAVSGSLEAGEHGEKALMAARKIGANMALKKPFKPEDLVGAVVRLIDPL